MTTFEALKHLIENKAVTVRTACNMIEEAYHNKQITLQDYQILKSLDLRDEEFHNYLKSLGLE